MRVSLLKLNEKGEATRQNIKISVNPRTNWVIFTLEVLEEIRISKTKSDTGENLEIDIIVRIFK